MPTYKLPIYPIPPQYIQILEIANGWVKYEEGTVITIDSFPTTPKVGQQWLMRLNGDRIVQLELVEDVNDASE